MLIYGALAIALLTLAALYFTRRECLVWWEALILLFAPLLFVICAKALVETAKTADTEFFGSFVVEAVFTESWDERVDCTHTKQKDEEYDCSTNFARPANIRELIFSIFCVQMRWILAGL